MITTDTPHAIDTVYQGGLKDPWAQHRPEQAFRVIGESTREEWIECLVSFGEDREWAEFLSYLSPYFYEIQTD